jgi:5-methylcytosine-specific restriction endonuclease McrA
MPKLTNIKNNKGSNYYGVYYNKKLDKWFCKINQNYKLQIFGPFDDEIKAAQFYDDTAPRMLKKMRGLNFGDISKKKDTDKIKIKKIKKIKKNKKIEKNIKNIYRIKKGSIERETIFSKYNHKCNICNKQNDISFELDHIIPLEYNGEDNLFNLQPLCKNCHKIKTHRIDEIIGYSIKNNDNFNIKDALNIQRNYMIKNGYISDNIIHNNDIITFKNKLISHIMDLDLNVN